MAYIANERRYDNMSYRRVGNSGLRLPLLSLGLWQNFGEAEPLARAREILYHAFDRGICHFDLANNYGPPYGAAEETFGRILAGGLKGYRDELLISSKAGYDMWPGPYGIGGSRKYLVASIDQSLKRTGLDYFDIFYSHCPDPETPLEETVAALDFIVRSGRALYVGISSYSPERTAAVAQQLRALGTPCVIHQPRYNLLDRAIEQGLLDTLAEQRMGAIVFSPLAQGVLTGKYLDRIPSDSRAARDHQVHLQRNDLTAETLSKVRKLAEISARRGQSLAQMALAWVLRHEQVASALIGVSRSEQLDDCLAALERLDFSAQELEQIESVLGVAQPA